MFPNTYYNNYLYSYMIILYIGIETNMLLADVTIFDDSLTLLT